MLSSVPRSVARRQSLPASAAVIAPIAFTRSLATRARHHRADSAVEDEPLSYKEHSLSQSLEHMHLPVHSDARTACRQIAAHYWSATNAPQADKVARWRASSESVHFDLNSASSSSVDLAHLWQTPVQKSASTSDFLKSSSRMSFIAGESSSVLSQMAGARRLMHTQSAHYTEHKKNIDSLSSKPYADLDKYGPYLHNESPKESFSEYDDLHMYRPKKFDPMQAHVTKAGPKYDDLDRYQNPIGGPVKSTTESFPKYDDLHLYGPAHVDSLPEDTTIPKYEDIDEYNVDDIQHEPPKTVVGKASSIVNSIDKIMANHVRVPAEDKSKEYTDLGSYGPVKWNEPDGERPLTAEEKSKFYKDLHLYDGPVQFNEPNGQAPPSAEELSKKYSDLHNYGPVEHLEPNGQPPKSKEELSKKYRDLDQYSGGYKFNEPDGKLETSKEEKSKNYTDLNNYGPVFYLEPDGKPTESKYAPSSIGYFPQATPSSPSDTNSRITDAKPSIASGLSPGRNQGPSGNSTSWILAQSEADPYSLVPQGLQTSYSDEIGGAPTAGLTHVRSFGTVSQKSATVDIAEVPKEKFRVFVYDEAMDKMSVAETYTVTPENHKTMSPTEALLELAHPAKFLPFFENMRTQGFEIVASHGNVLVFHQVKGDHPPIAKIHTIDRASFILDIRPDYTLNVMGGVSVPPQPSVPIKPMSKNEADFVSMLEKQNKHGKWNPMWSVVRKTLAYSVAGYVILKAGEQLGRSRATESMSAVGP